MKKEESAHNNSHRSSQKQEEVQPSIEYSGNIVRRNIWYKIGLSPAESAALKKIRARLFNKPESVQMATTARRLLLAAIAHYSKLEPYIYADVRYVKEEGIGWVEEYQEALMIKAFNLKNVGIDKWK